MRRQIHEAYPDESFAFDFDTVPTRESCTTFMRVMRTMGRTPFCLSVLPESKWSDVQRVIDRKLARDITPDAPDMCPICEHDNVSMLINCNICSNEICGDCYIQLFEAGAGHLVCPYCRCETGYKMSRREVAGRTQAEVCADAWLKNHASQHIHTYIP